MNHTQQRKLKLKLDKHCPLQYDDYEDNMSILDGKNFLDIESA